MFLTFPKKAFLYFLQIVSFKVNLHEIQIVFSMKNKTKYISKCLLLNFLHSTLSFNMVKCNYTNIHYKCKHAAHDKYFFFSVKNYKRNYVCTDNRNVSLCNYLKNLYSYKEKAIILEHSSLKEPNKFRKFLKLWWKCDFKRSV